MIYNEDDHLPAELLSYGTSTGSGTLTTGFVSTWPSTPSTYHTYTYYPCQCGGTVYVDKTKKAMAIVDKLMEDGIVSNKISVKKYRELIDTVSNEL